METTWGLEARIETGEWEHIGMYATRGAAIHAALQEHPFATHGEDGCSVFGLTRDTVNGRQTTEYVTIEPTADGGLRLREIYP
jgi:hypothetical protein